MVRNFLVSMFAILLFTLGGAASWFYVQVMQSKADETMEESRTSMPVNPDPIPKPREQAVSLPAVIRGPALDAEEMFRLSTATAAKREQLRQYEERLREHKLRIRAADADTKAAQREVEGTLEQIRNMMNATEQLLSDTQLAIQDLQKTNAEIKRKSEDLKQIETEAGATEAARVRTFAEYLQSMPPNDAAEAIKEMVNNGNMDFAIQLLRQIEPRNVSKILEEIRDPQLIAEIASRYPIAPTAPKFR